MGTRIGRFFRKVGDVVKKVAESDVGKRIGKKALDMAEK